MKRLTLVAIALGLWPAVCAGVLRAADAVVADPASIHLTKPGQRHGILVYYRDAFGRLADLTGQASFHSLTPDIVSVSSLGVVRGVSDGDGRVEVVARGTTQIVDVSVANAAAPRQYNFENDIVPLLSRHGCNSSGCHGKAEGQNGFKLSVFGFDPQADYDALAKESRGRRVFPAAPDRSLLLRKVCGAKPHGGGVRISRGSRAYETLHGWIAAGLPRGDAADPRVVSIELAPLERIMAMNATQRLRVVATYTDGYCEDVTALARFQSNNDALVSVDEAGLVSAGQTPGQAAVMASYMGAVDVFQTLIPRQEFSGDYPDLPEHNYIDALVHRKLKKLNILPSELADDATYLRRVYFDVIGTAPTVAQTRAFLADGRRDKRQRLVDALLERPEFADYWALYWADLLRVDRQTLGHKAAYTFYAWIRESLAGAKPLDEFAREILTAEGTLRDCPPVAFYQVAKRPGEMASSFSQAFLGVRIACAQCHHHPFDRWSQRDYYGMQAMFAQARHKKRGAYDVLMFEGSPVTKHPRSGEAVPPYALATPMPAEAPSAPEGDRRRILADWLTRPDNAFFASNMANRVWARFLGRGLVEPVDDFRETNPPTNPELLDALAQRLVEAKFDFRALIRDITASAAYQRSPHPNATNQRDEQNYSRALLKRMPAEVLFDAVCQTTGSPEKFAGMPSGYRAIQLWDSRTTHYFLKLFGRPLRETACECERNAEASVAQVLHLMNSPEIQAKLSYSGGAVRRMEAEFADHAALAEELYLNFYNRFPTETERGAAVDYLAKSADHRRQATEDLAWSMLNSLEFVFNH